MRRRHTNDGLSYREVVKREKTARRSGRWPPWQEHEIDGHTFGNGWTRECKKAFENGVFSVLVREVDTPWGTVTHAAIRTAKNAVDITWAEKTADQR